MTSVAMMFQSSALYPHRTVGENMAFSLRMRKADTATTGKHVNKAATILNLDLRLDRYPHDIAAKVIVVEFTGAQTGRAVRIDSAEAGDAPSVAGSHDRTDAQPDVTVHLKAVPRDAHVFDAATGQRVC